MCWGGGLPGFFPVRPPEDFKWNSPYVYSSVSRLLLRVQQFLKNSSAVQWVYSAHYNALYAHCTLIWVLFVCVVFRSYKYRQLKEQRLMPYSGCIRRKMFGKKKNACHVVPQQVNVFLPVKLLPCKISNIKDTGGRCR